MRTSGFARVVLSALSLFAFAAQPAMGDQLGKITEDGSGLPAGAQTIGIASGPDGAMWFTDAGSPGMLGRITTQSQMTLYSAGLNAGASPYLIVAGPDGNLWFTDLGTAKAIGRITPAGQVTEFSIGLNPGSYPAAITEGPDGNLWFTDEGSTPAIGRVTPSGQITEFTSGLLFASRPELIAAGPDGNLWFTDVGTTKAIGRITPAGQITEFTSGLNSGSYPGAIAEGPDGNLWFTDQGSTPAIGRITTSATITEFSNGLNPSSRPTGIAAGPDGTVWFTDPASSQPAVGRITPQGLIAEFSGGLNPGSGPDIIAPGADGNLWFADDGTTKAIGRVGAGAPTALQSAPAVSGSGVAGAAETCQAATWSTWAGVAPSATLTSFDGYQWLRDGAAIAGQTGQSYTPPAGDIGHQLSCRLTVSYPLPFLVTAPADSTPVTVTSPSVNPPPPSAPSLTLLRISPHTFSLSGRKVAGHCVKTTRANRRRRRCRRSPALRVSFMLSGPASVTVTIGRLSCARRRPCTHWIAMPGALTLTGAAGGESFTFAGRIGGRLLGQGSYRLIATPAAGGHTGTPQTAAFQLAG